jgi:hypothetical protein
VVPARKGAAVTEPPSVGWSGVQGHRRGILALAIVLNLMWVSPWPWIALDAWLQAWSRGGREGDGASSSLLATSRWRCSSGSPERPFHGTIHSATASEAMPRIAAGGLGCSKTGADQDVA